MRTSLFLLMVTIAMAGCEVTRETVLNPDNVPVDRIVVETPGGDYVPVVIDVVERIVPILPEPWNTIAAAVLGAFGMVTAGWVWRSRKKK